MGWGAYLSSKIGIHLGFTWLFLSSAPAPPSGRGNARLSGSPSPSGEQTGELVNKGPRMRINVSQMHVALPPLRILLKGKRWEEEVWEAILHLTHEQLVLDQIFPLPLAQGVLVTLSARGLVGDGHEWPDPRRPPWLRAGHRVGAEGLVRAMSRAAFNSPTHPRALSPLPSTPLTPQQESPSLWRTQVASEDNPGLEGEGGPRDQ